MRLKFSTVILAYSPALLFIVETDSKLDAAVTEPNTGRVYGMMWYSLPNPPCAKGVGGKKGG